MELGSPVVAPSAPRCARLATTGFTTAHIADGDALPLTLVTERHGLRARQSLVTVAADLRHPVLAGFLRLLARSPAPDATTAELARRLGTVDAGVLQRAISVTRALETALPPAPDAGRRFDALLASGRRLALSDLVTRGAMTCVPQAILACHGLARLGVASAVVWGHVDAGRGPRPHAYLVVPGIDCDLIFDAMTPVTDSTSGRRFPDLLAVPAGHLTRLRTGARMELVQSIYFPEIRRHYGVGR